MQSEWTKCLDAFCPRDPIHRIQEITSHTWEIYFCTYGLFTLFSIHPLTFPQSEFSIHRFSLVLTGQICYLTHWPYQILKGSWIGCHQNFSFRTCSAQASPDSSECCVISSLLICSGHRRYVNGKWASLEQRVSRVAASASRHGQAGCRSLSWALTSTGYGQCWVCTSPDHCVGRSEHVGLLVRGLYPYRTRCDSDRRAWVWS